MIPPMLPNKNHRSDLGQEVKRLVGQIVGATGDRDGRFGPEEGQIRTKLDKSGTFQISNVHTKLHNEMSDWPQMGQIGDQLILKSPNQNNLN